MCGIAGEIRFDGRPADLAAIEQITAAQRSRGPDAQRTFADGVVALGHARLKIIDLSDAADQPMHDADAGLTIVFNGCIYNFRELRADLESRGHTFETHSDTEVLLKSYREWGKHCVERLNGMFAFAVYDRNEQSLFVARDRLGIKPFYYIDDGTRFRFASFLPALAHSNPGARDMDPTALNNYMSFHGVVPSPRTVFAQIRKLPPATRATITTDGRWHAENYWQPQFRRNGAGRSFEDWQEAVIHGLETAVRRRMIADVPVGVLLSGGLDSSLVVGLLAHAGVHGLNTFSVGFESAGGEIGNEFEYSDIIAEEFASEHHRFTISSKELVEHLPACFGAMAEPMVSHDAIGFYLLSREVAKHVTVVQSGQGADEIFGGYYWYPPMLESESAVDDYAGLFLDRDYEEMQRALCSPYLNGDVSRQFISDTFANAPADTAVDKALYMDSTVMLTEDPLKRVDNMTMAWSLEARVPFLDHELVELAASIPPEMKVGGGGKHVLKEGARAVIPSEVIDRPKGFFPVPELKYLHGPALEFVRDALNSDVSRKRGIFQREYIDFLLDEPTEHITPLRGSKLWQVAVLEIWLQTHGL